VKATIKRFVEYCQARGLKLHDRNFSVRYDTNVPRQVGLAGSSAIIVATMRCLLEYYEVDMPAEVQPSFVLSVETEELGITAGLQDRVIQCYEGLVYMDFDRNHAHQIHGLTCYAYEPLDMTWLPPLYIAYHAAFSEPTEVFHNDLRGRYNRGEAEVINAMQQFADITAQGRAAILKQDIAQLSALIDENFDTRRRIARLPDWQVQMVETARSCGASAKFAGSGGAIVGIYHDEAVFEKLSAAMPTIGSRVLKPQVRA
jgi:glucuronokinase